MTISFKNISQGSYKAYISDIEEIYNKSGFFLRFLFTVHDSGFIEHNFSLTLKVSGSKNSNFYRFITKLLGHQTNLINTDDLIGKQFLIYITNTNNNCLSIRNVSPLL